LRKDETAKPVLDAGAARSQPVHRGLVGGGVLEGGVYLNKGKNHRSEMLEEYIRTRQELIRSQDRVFWAMLFIGMVGLAFLLVLVLLGLRLDTIDFFSNMMRG